MAWDYADLSKKAKQAGGPEEFVNQLIAQSQKNGQQKMLPWVGVGALVGTGIGIGATKLIEYFQNKRAMSEKALEEARDELVKGIKAYDAEQISADDEENDEI